MRSLAKTNLLKEKCLAELEIMLPYHELSFNVTANQKNINSIELQMRDKSIFITKGRKQFFNPCNEVRKCLIDIYYEFEDEIQSLFDLKL